MSLCPFAESKWVSAMPCEMETCNFLNSKHHMHFSSSSLAAKQDVFPSVFPHPELEVAGGLSSKDQCAIMPNRIASALGPGLSALLCLLSQGSGAA